MFFELTAMKNLKYAHPLVKSLFLGKIPTVPLTGRLKYFIISQDILKYLLKIYIYRLKYLVSSERLQNIILNISSTTEKANGDLLFTKPTASDFGRNSGNVEKGCTSQNDTKTEQQLGVP